MKIKKFKRYELIYVNRLCEDYVVYFDDIRDILNFIDNFAKNIIYIKTLYDYKAHKYIWNIYKVRRDSIKEEDNL